MVNFSSTIRYAHPSLPPLEQLLYLFTKKLSPMRILLILPDGHIHKLKLGPVERSMREAPITMTTLAALAPPELNIAFTIIDESIDRIPLDAPALTELRKRGILIYGAFLFGMPGDSPALMDKTLAFARQ